MPATKKKLPPGMSQLDYLWTYFGNYEVADTYEESSDINKIVSQQALNQCLAKYSEGVVTSMKLIPKPGTNNLLQLIACNKDGSELSIVELPKEDHLSGVEFKLSTQVEIDKGACSELDEPLLIFTMNSGKEYYVLLNQFKYIGGESNSIKTTVVDNKITAHLKLDKSVETPVVDVDITNNGLKIDLTINPDSADNQLKLVRTRNGLDTTYTWEDGNNILFEVLNYNDYHTLSRIVPGKIYFIPDANCIYLNEIRYGNNLSIQESNTIEVINNANVLTLEVKIDPDEDNLITKSNAGLAAKLYWDE